MAATDAAFDQGKFAPSEALRSILVCEVEPVLSRESSSEGTCASTVGTGLDRS